MDNNLKKYLENQIKKYEKIILNSNDVEEIEKANNNLNTCYEILEENKIYV